MPLLTARNKRFAIRLDLDVSGQTVTGRPFAEHTRSLNVSGGGLCCELRSHVEVGTRLSLYVQVPAVLRHHFGGRSVYRVRSIVCRVEHFEGEQLSRVGVRFLGEIEA